MTDIKPALLSKSEIDYLLGKRQMIHNYEYVIRYRIKETRPVHTTRTTIIIGKGTTLTEYSKNLTT